MTIWMRRLAAGLEWLAFTLWIGGLVVLGGLVAPTLFRTLSRDQAGRAFGAVLGRFQPLALVCGLLMLGVGLVLRLSGRPLSGLARLKYGLVVVMLLPHLIIGWGIIPAMARLQTTVGQPWEQVPPDHPARLEFERLHDLATTLLSGTLIGGVLLLGLLVLTWVESGQPSGGQQ